MKNISAITTSPSLDDYLSCSDEARAWQLLTSIITERVEPVARSYIRGKLNTSLRPDDDRQVNEDALDLVSEVKALVITKLKRLSASPGTSEPIGNLEAYTMAVTVNVYNGYLRKKYPRRLQLKDQLRYILSHDPRYSLWRSDSGEWTCTLRGEEAKSFRGSTAELHDDIAADLTRRGVAAERLKLSQLLKIVLTQAGGAMRFVDAVTVIYLLRGTTEPLAADDHDAAAHMASDADNIVFRLEREDELKRLWTELGTLPVRHRAAVLLNLRNNSGDGLITLLPLLGIASIRQIADVLEFPRDEFAGVWSDLPWDDLAIAEHLKITRQQVINLRQSARAKLRRGLSRG